MGNSLVSATGEEPFPTGFVWGVATSAYQIEGAVAADGRGPSIWDAFCRLSGAIRTGESGDITTDHYHRHREDVRLMARIGVHAYRFSISWPRIQPTGRGAALAKGLDFYSRLVDDLLGAGIEPIVTLYHWDLPQALEDAGGWPARSTARRFGDYASVVFGALGDRVRRWGTINEPWCVAFPGYAAGTAAPGVARPDCAIAATHHVLLAHGVAVETLRAIDPSVQLGIFVNLHPVRAVDPRPGHALNDGVRRLDGLQNRLFLDPLLRGSYPRDVLEDLRPYGALPTRDGDLELIAQPLDWLGINYYFDRLVAHDPGSPALDAYPGVSGIREVPAGTAATDMGWPITPGGLRDLVARLRTDYPRLPPLVISENGAAFDDPPDADGQIDDARRIKYLDAHIRSVRSAIADGADIRGYFVWSLLDNFEWAEGYAKRFGLVHVDFATLRRTPRRSALWYANVIARNGLGARPDESN